MAINLASKFSKYVDDAFARESLLRGAVNNKVEFTGVNEVFKAGQHSVSLTFGESASTVYQRVARHGRGDVRGYELPKITSRRVRILMPGNDWQTATINSPKTGV